MHPADPMDHLLNAVLVARDNIVTQWPNLAPYLGLWTVSAVQCTGGVCTIHDDCLT